MFPRAKWPMAALTLAVVCVGSAVSAPAAVTLVNRDEKDHKITVIEDAGTKTTDHTLKPSQVLEGICDKGCIVRLNDSEEDEYELEANDKVSIEEGYLYYDEPGASQPGAAAPAPQPAPPSGSDGAPKK